MFRSLLKQSVSIRGSRWLECCVVTMAVLSAGDCVYSCSVWYCMVTALTQGGGLVVSKG